MRTSHNLRDNLLSRPARACVEEVDIPCIVIAAWNCVTLRETARGHLPDAQANDTLRYADVVHLCETKICADNDVQRCALGTEVTQKTIVAHHPAANPTCGGSMLQISSTLSCQHAASSPLFLGGYRHPETVQAVVQKGSMPTVKVIGVYNPPSHSAQNACNK